MRLRIERKGSSEAQVQRARVLRGGTLECHLAVHPGTGADFQTQAATAYERLLEALGSEGLSPQDLVSERLCFSRIEAQFDALEQVRARAYQQAGVSAEERPTATFLQQPPCVRGRLLELQAVALAGSDATPVSVRPVPGLPGLASGKVVEQGLSRHIHLSNITGAGESDVPIAEQARRMFERADACLRRVGATFDEVVRTWIYLSDIERDYDAFNPVRTRFYEEKGLTRIPASTGIQGGTYPAHAACTMGLYAVLPAPGTQIDRMHAPTMNEAPAYGSTFSRGMLVRQPGGVVAYISGTASIDESGRVVHVGDAAAQAERTLDNVAALLREAGAGLDDLVSVNTYLKSAEFLKPFRAVWDRRGLPDGLPNTITVADVCRPEWLCEIEAIAVYAGAQP